MSVPPLQPLMKSIDNPDREKFCTDLLQRMTLEEKIGQMVQVDLSWKQDLKIMLKSGRVGSILTVSNPQVINELQHIAADESRLKIPLLVGNDIIHGYRTIFPIPLALACSWDPDLVEQIARSSMAEAVAAGTNWNFAPMVDICRDPRWGRIAESAGEDPLLGSRLAQAWVRGYQGYRAGNQRHAAACVKHFAAYGAAEAGKDYNTVDMSERRLREEYLPPYLAALRTGAGTVMTSFNDLNGLPATANPFLLKQILRHEWGFDGLIVSDYDSIGELVLHGFARDLKEAALRSILAGVDMDMMSDAYHLHLAELVQEGKVPEALLDESVLRILRLKYDLGLFENPYCEPESAGSHMMQCEALALAQKAAAQSIVLLKNEDAVLPLKRDVKTIALIGPMADERHSLMGCWSFDGRAPDVETLQEALQRSLKPDCRLLVEKGCSIEGDDSDFTAAVQAASQADIVLLALGESNTMSGEAHCRANTGLPGRQQQLVEAIAACGKPLAALLFAGRPLIITQLESSVQGLIMAWHGGTRAAAALVDVLLGRHNPCGKLAVSFPRSTGQIPVYYAHKRTGRPVDTSGTLQFNEAHKSAYLDESNEPLFPFGFGLSYTRFEYSDLNILNPRLAKDEVLRVSAAITNCGKTGGSEMVQLYVRDMVGSVTRPVKELKDFQKVTLEAGESCRVEFSLPATALAFLDVDLQPMLEAGEYRLWLGSSSQDGLEGSFELV